MATHYFNVLLTVVSLFIFLSYLQTWSIREAIRCLVNLTMIYHSFRLVLLLFCGKMLHHQQIGWEYQRYCENPAIVTRLNLDIDV